MDFFDIFHMRHRKCKIHKYMSKLIEKHLFLQMCKLLIYTSAELNLVCSQHFAALLMIIYIVSSSNSGVYFLKHAPYVIAWGHDFSLNIIS